MRIGKQRDGSKVGVFLYCQQHAREWATPLTCLETAEQLLRNYAIDPNVRELVDNLDIFILPSSNPDGSHFSMHNFNMQRKNLTNHCVVGGKETDNPLAGDFWSPRTQPDTGTPYTAIDPAARNLWGVDLNRNNTAATLFDGFIGASHSCTSEIYTGPGEASEPEIQNEHWIADTFPNIKFSNNIHSFGGYFMWAPGAYQPNRGEGEADHANIGVEKYFFAAGDRILNRIKEVRNTAILPERTGPIADVLYSAAGNSADEHWYNRDVIAYSFETGADLYYSTLSSAAPAGAPGIRLGTGQLAYLKPGDTLVVGARTPTQERRTVASIVRPNPSSPAPNVLFTEPLSNAHAAGTRVEGEALQTGVGFQPDYATEGKFEALEFAAGNIGLLESAYAYSRDGEGPAVRMTGPSCSTSEVVTTFEWLNEPSVIRYTRDGSQPNATSALWDATGPREPGEEFHVTETTTFRWTAQDIKGNTSSGQQTFVIANRCDNPGGGPGQPGPKAGRCTNLLAVTAGRALTATAAGEQITGTEGADTVNAAGGDDCVDGLGGDDDLRGGPGVDAIDGQRGNDRIRGDRGRGNLRGGQGNDRIAGYRSRDVLSGNTGRDRLHGGRERDLLFGGAGRDRLTGGGGKDVIEAGTGNDRIFARDGRADRIDCGFGRDTVVSRDRGDKMTSCERKGRISR